MLDPREVAQMSKFIAAINATGGSTDHAPVAGGSSHAPVVDSGVAEMKAILERFHQAADNVVRDSSSDRELREALITEPTESGARIGAWEIRARVSGQHKLYDVVNVCTHQSLARDLLLYEAARGLVRILNNGGRINSIPAIQLLQAEQEYGQLVQDMVLYRHRLTKQPNSRRRPIFEARYGDAKRRAVLARDRVYKLADMC